MATTTTTSALQVLTAIYTALNVPEIVTALACPVYDYVPQAATFPHLRISSPSATPWDTFGTAGKQRIVEVHVFTQYRGQTRAIQILDKVIELLEHQDLVISDHETCGIQYESDGEGAYETIANVPVEHRFVQFRVTVREDF